MSTKFNDNVEITNINVVGYWNWTVHNNTCAICRNYIFESPNDSEVNETMACIGVCNHAYHFSCIDNWLKTKNVCPLCNVKWKYQKND